MNSWELWAGRLGRRRSALGIPLLSWKGWILLLWIRDELCSLRRPFREFPFCRNQKKCQANNTCLVSDEQKEQIQQLKEIESLIQMHSRAVPWWKWEIPISFLLTFQRPPPQNSTFNDQTLARQESACLGTVTVSKWPVPARRSRLQFSPLDLFWYLRYESKNFTFQFNLANQIRPLCNYSQSNSGTPTEIPLLLVSWW